MTLTQDELFSIPNSEIILKLCINVEITVLHINDSNFPDFSFEFKAKVLHKSMPVNYFLTSQKNILTRLDAFHLKMANITKNKFM